MLGRRTDGTRRRELLRSEYLKIWCAGICRASGAGAYRDRSFKHWPSLHGIIHEAGILLFCFAPVCLRHCAMHLARFGICSRIGQRFMHRCALTIFGRRKIAFHSSSSGSVLSTRQHQHADEGWLRRNPCTGKPAWPCRQLQACNLRQNCRDVNRNRSISARLRNVQKNRPGWGCNS